MKIKTKYILVWSIFISLLVFAPLARAQNFSLWKYVSSLLQPVVSTWDVYAPSDLRFDGEIQPDGATCGAGEILKRTGANDWDCSADASASPAGSDTQVQFNDGGVFGGDADFTYTKSTDTLGVKTVLINQVSGGNLVFDTGLGTATLNGLGGLGGTASFISIDSTLLNDVSDQTISAGTKIWNDNIIAAFGTASDARLSYNGTNFILNPKAVGTGYFDVQGNLAVNNKLFSSDSVDANQNTFIQFNANDRMSMTAGGNEFLDANEGATDVLTLGTSWDIDSGGANSFELPNGAAPTTNVFGETAGDNNAWATSRGALQTFDGTANTYLVGALAADTPTQGQMPSWNSNGTITWETATTTKEISVTPTNASGVLYKDGFPVSPLDSSGSVGFTFRVPDDFTGVATSTILIIGTGNATKQYDLTVSKAALGEAYTANTTTVVDGLYTETTNTLVEVDITSSFTGVVAGDWVGVVYESDTTSEYVVMLRFKYNWR